MDGLQAWVVAFTSISYFVNFVYLPRRQRNTCTDFSSIATNIGLSPKAVSLRSGTIGHETIIEGKDLAKLGFVQLSSSITPQRVRFSLLFFAHMPHVI
jgi:hypothetical protein